jgi:[ribosomal protein S5]-alanine N-acetyltransferase
MILETKRLRLRPLSIGDAERIEELAGNYDVAKTTSTIPHPYPKGSAKDFIRNVLEAANKGKLVIFAITLRGTHEIVGLINIHVNQANNRGELGYWIGKPFWGSGYGTEAANAVLTIGFKKLKLNKIYAQAFTSNPGSWKIMEKIGLTYEGTLKQHIYRFGEYFDLAVYGMVREDYVEISK